MQSGQYITPFFSVSGGGIFTANRLTDIVDFWAVHQSDKIAYRFLADDLNEEETLSFGELEKRAKCIATHLRANNHQGCALLLYPAGLEYITAFLGCLYAGIIAVPAYSVTSQVQHERLKGILSNSQAQLLLTCETDKAVVDQWLSACRQARRISCIATDTLPDIDIIEPAVSEPIAFLQYTSGSTGNPKGVIVTHRNLLHNLEQIYLSFQHSQNSIGVSWLPAYHDMGLIGGILQPLFGGFEANLMSPLTFLRRPSRWLAAISKYKATSSGGPNFAYELCIKYAGSKSLEGIDLSSWNIAFNGSEPIRATTLKNFSVAFEYAGFKKKAFCPCYGLAESSLFVTGPKVDQEFSIINADKQQLMQGSFTPSSDNHNTVELVSSGFPTGTDLIIIDPVSHELRNDAHIGEIWIKSSSVADGYWQKTAETSSTFGAYTKSGQGPYMRSGDLGFMYQCELYVTGRCKEVIILNGCNYYPYDIEHTVQACGDILRTDATVAFSVDTNGTEKLIIIQELYRNQTNTVDIVQLKKNIHEHVYEKHGLIIHDLVLVKQATLPKTTSGKLKRVEIKQQYLANTIQNKILLYQNVS
jgi:acyl-CoA synthetase (AMP-forming)/AMP-acid ligase II